MIIPKEVTNIMSHLISHGFEAYVIGGATRDYYFNEIPHDWDLFTNATGEEILKVFPDGNVIGNEERQEKILTVMVDGVEVSQFRKSGDRTEVGTTLEEHQRTCDFYMNALAVDINGKLCGDSETIQKGISNILHKDLRFVGNSQDRVNEDPLRVLRGIRFKLKYNLIMDEETGRALRQNVTKLVAKERIRDELIKIIKYKINEFDFINYLWPYFPFEFIDTRMLRSGGKHHNETPFHHCLNTFNETHKLTNDYRKKIAGLFHDVGKGEARTEDETGIHFYNHETIGAEIARKWMSDLRFSNDDISYVTHLIKTHMFGYKADILDKTYLKFFDTLKSKGISIMDYIILIYSDHQGNLAKDRIKFVDFINGNYLYQNYIRLLAENKPFNPNDLEINGRDIIDILKVKGPEIAKAKNEIFNMVAEGAVINRRDKLLEVLNNIKKVKEK